MRLQGKFTRWDDERGFGFISSHDDGSSVFVHIKAFSLKSRRPEVGDIVSYEMTRDKGGRPRAEKVRFSGQSKPKNKSTHQDSPLPVFLAALFVCIMLGAASFGLIPWLVVGVYFTASLLTFFTYGWDKFSARRSNWRTPESTLHLMGLVGGWPGALAAQRLLRHKSRKKEFLLMFWVTVFLNVTAISYLVGYGFIS